MLSFLAKETETRPNLLVANFSRAGKNKNKKQMSFDELPELLTIADASHLLNVHQNTLRNWEKEGLINVVRLGKRRDRRYPKALIKKMVEGLT